MWPYYGGNGRAFILCPLPRLRFGDVCTGMTEQERAAALVARSRRMNSHRRRRTPRSGSGGSGNSVADSVGSRRGSTPVLSTSGGGGKGGSEFSSLTRVEGSADRQGSRTRSPAGDRSGLDVRSPRPWRSVR